MYQQVTIIGNVGRDPEMRQTSTGVGVSSFSVAVNRSWTDQRTNERKSETTWFSISAWDRLGDTCQKYVRKGMLVMVIGEVKARPYQSNNGEARASLDLRARDVRFLTRADDMGGGGDSYADEPGGGGYQQDYTEDDIPF